MHPLGLTAVPVQELLQLKGGKSSAEGNQPSQQAGSSSTNSEVRWHCAVHHAQAACPLASARTRCPQAMSTTDAMDILRKVLLMRQQGSEENGRTGAAVSAAAAANPDSTDAAAPVRPCHPKRQPLLAHCQLSMITGLLPETGNSVYRAAACLLSFQRTSSRCPASATRQPYPGLLLSG